MVPDEPDGNASRLTDVLSGKALAAGFTAMDRPSATPPRASPLSLIGPGNRA
jgi:hypothetical protein